jgi:hypothetical protein
MTATGRAFTKLAPSGCPVRRGHREQRCGSQATGRAAAPAPYRSGESIDRGRSQDQRVFRADHCLRPRPVSARPHLASELAVVMATGLAAG